MAHATDPVGPSAVGQGETAVVATANAPYAIATPETGDTTNVVSASYVKGAYNDAISAINKVNSDLGNAIDEKQNKLAGGASNFNGGYAYDFLMQGNDLISIGENIPTFDDNEISGMSNNSELANFIPSVAGVAGMLYGTTKGLQEELQEKLTGETGDVSSQLLMSDTFLGAAIMTDYNMVSTDNSLENTIPSTLGVASYIKGAIDTQRVSAVTTWGDDSHPTKLQLTTASN